MIWAVGLLLSIVSDLPANSAPTASDVAAIVGITGNARLTVGIDGQGALAQLRWPTRGFSDHLNYDFSVSREEAGGARWVIEENGATYHFNAANWAIEHRTGPHGELITQYRERNGPRSAEQRIFVAEDQDMVVVDLVLDAFSPNLRCFWHQRIAPSFVPVPGVPEAYTAFQRKQGFGAYYDPEDSMAVQFSPRDPQHEEWVRVRRLDRDDAPAVAWSAFGAGAYWGTFSPGGMVQIHCGPASSSLERMLQFDGKTEHNGVSGPAQVLMEPMPQGTPDNKRRQVVCLAVAPSNAGLRHARRTVTPEVLPSEAVFPPLAAGSDEKALRALLACIDVPSGAVLQSPVSYPPIAYTTVLDSTWASAALDGRGLTSEAALALDFHLDRVGSNGIPGSTSTATFTTGTPARMLDSANPAATAWLLAAMWRHCAALSLPESEAYLAARIGAIEASGDYLSHASVVGGVLSGALKPQAAPLATLQTHYLGMLSARAMLEHLGRVEPDLWRNRREEAYTRIRFRQLGSIGDGVEDRGSSWLAYWVAQLPKNAKSDQPLWQVLVSETPITGATLMEDWASNGQAPVSANVPIAMRSALQLLDAGHPPEESSLVPEEF